MARGETAQRVPLGLKLGYSAGQLVDGIMSNSLSIFLLFYLTAVCGLSGAMAGAALSVGLVVDAVLDPLIGSLSDGWHSTLGRRLPFMIAGAPLVCVLFVLIFALPQKWNIWEVFAWLSVISVLLRFALSLYILPFQAAGAELSDDYNERSSLVAWRWGVGMLGAMGAILLGYGVFFAGPGGPLNRQAYPLFAASLSAISFAGALISVRSIMSLRDRMHPPPAKQEIFLRRFFQEMAEVFRNRTFRTLFAGSLLFFTGLGVNMALGLHANTFFWGLTPRQIELVTLATFGGLLAGAPLAGPFLSLSEKKTIAMTGIAGLALAQGVMPSLRLIGVLSLSGDNLTYALSAVGFLGGVCIAVAGIIFGSMMADAVDEHEQLFHARREGLYFAAWSFAGKAAVGGGSLIAGLILQTIGFPSGIAQGRGAAIVIPPHTVAQLGLFFGPGAGFLTFLAALMMLLYKIDRRAHVEILADLTRRRQV